MPALTPLRKPSPHVPWLDGLRGFAALWVVLSHVRILTGLPGIPVLSWGGLAVDLFMMLSGFLMVHHYILRRDKEPWDSVDTGIRFWQRRFFRIAPLYYVLLAIALLLGPWLGEFRDAIAAVWPRTATAPERYLDQSLLNLLAHASFVFGATPEFAFRTALPDWSIGLEMQFYLAFPFLMHAISRLGVWTVAFGLAIACFIAIFLFPAFFDRFEMPSFLVLRLHVFLVGMLIAFGLAQGRLTQALMASILILVLSGLVFNLRPVVAQIGVTLCLYYIMNDGSLPASRHLAPVITRLRALLSGRTSRFLGNTSYATYLLHLMVVLPVAGTLAQYDAYVALPAVLRFGLVLGLVLPVTLALSALLYRFVELRGIQLGRALSSPVPRPAK